MLPIYFFERLVEMIFKVKIDYMDICSWKLKLKWHFMECGYESSGFGEITFIIIGWSYILVIFPQLTVESYLRAKCMHTYFYNPPDWSVKIKFEFHVFRIKNNVCCRNSQHLIILRIKHRISQDQSIQTHRNMEREIIIHWNVLM